MKLILENDYGIRFFQTDDKEYILAVIAILSDVRFGKDHDVTKSHPQQTRRIRPT